tara:strand:+ start:12212 stop:12589 length:378 start_codon:yes stop_codon:yes gene_type:complete
MEIERYAGTLKLKKMINKYQRDSILKRIADLLIEKPNLRDDDKRLCTHIWHRELQEKGLNLSSFLSTDFLRLYAEGKVTTDATIKRLRARVQDDKPELRGKKYLERITKQQQKVQTDLGYGKTYK